MDIVVTIVTGVWRQVVRRLDELVVIWSNNFREEGEVEVVLWVVGWEVVRVGWEVV